MKKIIVILFNFIFFFTLVFIMDYFYSALLYKEENIHNPSFNPKNFKYSQHFKRLYPFKQVFDNELTKNHFHKVLIEPDKIEKKAILLFGCSFAEGAGLQEKDNLSSKLSQLTKRIVYNFAVSACGPAEMLWMVKYDDFYKQIDYPVDYAIYVYIPCSLPRIYESKFGLVSLRPVGFINKNERLIEHTPFYYPIFSFKFLRHMKLKQIHKKLEIYNDNEINKNFDLLKHYFIEAKNELKKHYPDIKFIIIKYPSDGYSMDEPVPAAVYNSYRWKEFQNEGFIIYDLGKNINIDFSDKTFTLPDGHPNARTWKIITPKLVKDLNI